MKASSLHPAPRPATLGSGHPDNRNPRFRLAVYAADRAPHSRAERLLRRAPLHRAPGGNSSTTSPSASFSPAAPRRCTTPMRRWPIPRLLDLGRADARHLLRTAFHRASPRRQSAFGAQARIRPRRSQHRDTAKRRCSPGCRRRMQVWMSHGDEALELPPGFHRTAVTSNALAGIANEERRIWAVQFHPEVHHTPLGPQLLKNFVFTICGARGDWTPAHFVETTVAAIREKVGNGSRHLRALGRRRFVGRGRAGAQGHRQPAHLHLRQQRRAAQKRIRQACRRICATSSA